MRVQHERLYLKATCSLQQPKFLTDCDASKWSQVCFLMSRFLFLSLHFSCCCFQVFLLLCRSQVSHISTLCFCTKKGMDLLTCVQRYDIIPCDAKWSASKEALTYFQLVERDIFLLYSDQRLYRAVRFSCSKRTPLRQKVTVDL